MALSTWVGICLILSLSVQFTGAQDEPVTHKVGDSTGWTYINASSGQPADYAAWASQYQFWVKDVLRFVYEPNKQSIYSFRTKAAWEACNFTEGRLLDNGTSGFSEWILSKYAYYNLASGSHCEKGQKFRILAGNRSLQNTGQLAPTAAPAPSRVAPSPSKLAPTPSTTLSPAMSPASPPADLLLSLNRGPAVAPVVAPSASVPATWVQTLSLTTAGIAITTSMLVL